MSENNSNQIGLTAGAPAPASSIAAVYTGGGNTNVPVYYWVVARYPAGVTIPTGPAVAFGTIGAENLNASNYITVSWSPMPGATGYDVVRGISPQYPAQSGPAVCAVVVNTQAVTFVDTGASPVLYPDSSLLAAQASQAEFTLDGVTGSIPTIKVQATGAGGSVTGNLPILDPATSVGSPLTLKANNVIGASAGGALPISGGGTGLTTIGAADTLLGANHTDTGLEYKTITGTAPVTVTKTAGNINISMPGGTGNSVQVGLLSGLPATPNSNGDQYYATDGAVNYVGVGGVWVPVINGIPCLGAPVAATFPTAENTAVNPGTYSFGVVNGVLVMKGSGGSGIGGGNNVQWQIQNIPAAPYRIKCHFAQVLQSDNFAGCGIGWVDTVSTKSQIMSVSQNAGAPIMESAQYSDYSTFSSSLLQSNWLTKTIGGVFFMIEDDGVNRNCYYSADGKNYQLFNSVGNTSFFTPNAVGLVLKTYTASIPVVMSVYDWVVS